MENDTQRKLGDLNVNWTLFGRHDQVRPDRFLGGLMWFGHVFIITYFSSFITSFITHISLLCVVFRSEFKALGLW